MLLARMDETRRRSVRPLRELAIALRGILRRRVTQAITTSDFGNPTSTNGHGPLPWGMKTTGMRP